MFLKRMLFGTFVKRGRLRIVSPIFIHLFCKIRRGAINLIFAPRKSIFVQIFNFRPSRKFHQSPIASCVFFCDNMAFLFPRENLYFRTFKNAHFCDHVVPYISFIPVCILPFFNFPPNNPYFRIFKNGHFCDHFVSFIYPHLYPCIF